MHKRQVTTFTKPKDCYFCISGFNDIDYKDTRILQKFLSGYAKILPSKRSGLCLKHQRKFSLAVRRARIMALIPFVNK
ncbi:MAG: 30S ribosomal protein S18 [Patescibacteria group bacterium]